MPKAFAFIGLLTIVVMVSSYSPGLSQPPSSSSGESKSNGDKARSGGAAAGEARTPAFNTVPSYTPNAWPGSMPSNGPNTSFGIYQAETVDPAETAEFQRAISDLRTAESEEAKAKAREAVGELVGTQLDRDLEQREKALADIEARVKEMRSQLDERKKSKVEIQKMIMLMIEQPQVGLGLPRAWMNAIQPTSLYYPQTYSPSPTQFGTAATYNSGSSTTPAASQPSLKP